MRSGQCPLTTRIELQLSSYGLPSVRLDLSSSNIGEDMMQKLCNAIKNNRSLRELSLSNTNLDDACAGIMAKMLVDSNPCRLCTFQGLHLKLAELDMSHNRIGNAGATHLARALEKNDRLRELDLDANPIDDEGVQALADVAARNPFCRVHLS